MTAPNLTKLRELAKACPPFFPDKPYSGREEEALSDYSIAASPDVVLYMLDRIAQLESDRAGAVALADHFFELYERARGVRDERDALAEALRGLVLALPARKHDQAQYVAALGCATDTLAALTPPVKP